MLREARHSVLRKTAGPVLAISGCLMIALALAMAAQSAVRQATNIMAGLSRFQAPGYATFSRIMAEFAFWAGVGLLGLVCITTGILVHISASRCRCSQTF